MHQYISNVKQKNKSCSAKINLNKGFLLKFVDQNAESVILQRNITYAVFIKIFVQI